MVATGTRRPPWPPATALAAPAAALGLLLGLLRLRPRRVVVEGPSMVPALLPGDRLLLLRLRPRQGDVVAFRHPRHPGLVAVKRVAAAPGGAVVVDGAPLVAGAGYVLLGDHAGASTDSRHFGTVAPEAIVGRAVYRYAPDHRRGRPGHR